MASNNPPDDTGKSKTNTNIRWNNKRASTNEISKDSVNINMNHPMTTLQSNLHGMPTPNNLHRNLFMNTQISKAQSNPPPGFGNDQGVYK